MFSDREIAIQIREIVMNVDALLTRSTHIVKDSACPESEKRGYYKKVGKVTAILFIESLGEIFEKHPDLMPERYKAVSEGNPDPGWELRE